MAAGGVAASGRGGDPRAMNARQTRRRREAARARQAARRRRLGIAAVLAVALVAGIGGVAVFTASSHRQVVAGAGPLAGLQTGPAP
jgi:hypothetical protein